MKAKVICVYFLGIEIVVKMVFEVKSAVDYLSPYIYDYRFAQVKQSRKISQARMTSLHGLLVAVISLAFRNCAT